MKVPDWTIIVKLGRFKELAPYDEDWYYIRAGKNKKYTKQNGQRWCIILGNRKISKVDGFLIINCVLTHIFVHWHK